MEDLMIRDIDLQRFADDSEGAGQESGQDNVQGQEGQEDRTYSQEELDKAVGEATKGYVSQEKLQDIIDKTIAKERARAEKEAENAKRLANLSEKEKAEEQAKIDKETIEELRSQLARKELEDDTLKELSEQELPHYLVEFVIADNAENTFDRIKKFKEIFDKAVNAAVDKRFTGRSPKGTSTLSGADKQGKENIAAYAEKQRII